MIGWLGTVLICGALLIAALAGISALRRRAPWRATMAVVALTEVVLVVQAVVAIAVSFNGETADSQVLFFSYLFFVVLLLPVGVLLARAEPNRYGSLILLIAGLVLAVLVVRLQQIWGAGVG